MTARYDEYVNRDGSWTGTPDPSSGIKHYTVAETMEMMQDSGFREAVAMAGRVEGVKAAQQVFLGESDDAWKHRAIDRSSELARESFTRKGRAQNLDERGFPLKNVRERIVISK